MNAGFSNLDFLKKQLLASTLKNDVRFDKTIAALGLGVAAQFGNLCNRQFRRVVNDTAIFPADRAEFILPRTPVEAVTLAEIKNTEVEGWVTQTDPNFIRAINLSAGIVDCGPGDAGKYYAQVRFTYTGGFFWETLEPDDAAFPSAVPAGAATLPDELLNAWLLQCRHLWRQMDKLGVDILKDGDVKSLRFPEDFAPTVEKTIYQFTRTTLV
jgi:hypothetical protein